MMATIASENSAHEQIVVVDFGSQYTLLIARRLREIGVYSSVIPFDRLAQDDLSASVRGVILSGGPRSAADDDAPRIPKFLLDCGLPLLGICYGHQALCLELGGKVVPASERGYGAGNLELVAACSLTNDVWTGGMEPSVWLSHGDRVSELPAGFQVIAKSRSTPFAAVADVERNIYGVQFHPEVAHTQGGERLLKNFTHAICGCSGEWSMRSFRDQAIEEIRARVGERTVLCGLSGGVDSAVTAALLAAAIPGQVKCILVDTGLLRKDEASYVADIFTGHFGVDLTVAQESKRFFSALAGQSEPEAKRKIIGGKFIEVFDEHAAEMGGADFLAQGTLYPDVIESVSFHGGPSHTIKSHHNVGGLPERMQMELIEPLRALFKDEVRNLGRELGLSENFIRRHPFPGPGLAIRIPGEVTEEKAEILREADAIFIEEIHNAGIYDEIWQAFVVLLPVRSVGVMGDQRTWEWAASMRAVAASDGMTAEAYDFEPRFLRRVATRIVNDVRGINRVLYDCTSKPPATIEWE